MRKKMFGIFIIYIFLLTSIVQTLAVQNKIDTSKLLTVDCSGDDGLDMLIFVSPQYSSDAEIHQAINRYIEVVEDDIGWHTEIFNIDLEDNDFKKIDEVMESCYENYSVKACIMVGEDTDTALACDADYKEMPSTVPWFTTGGNDSYMIVNGQIFYDRNYRMDICISLIYPTHVLGYEIKSSRIASVFNKFSENKGVAYQENLLVFLGSHTDDVTKNNYQTLGEYGNLFYREDPNEIEIQESLENSYNMYNIFGHSTPSYTIINDTHNLIFEANMTDDLDTPLFTAGGCYVNGWWSDQSDNNILDPSIARDWYGSKIFTSKYVETMILGFPAQPFRNETYNFIRNAIPELVSGKTLAESMIGHNYTGDDQTLFGDPTFRFIFNDHPPTRPCKPSGKKLVETGVENIYNSNATDPDNDKIYYKFDWGDGNYSDWLGPYNSSEICEASHAWTLDGSYKIRVKARDIYRCESEWSEPLFVTVNDYNPYVEITKPENALYLMNTMIRSYLVRKPFIIGDIDIEVSVCGYWYEPIVVERVEFYIDNNLKNTDTSTPYVWTWDEKSLLKHKHTITVKAYDENGLIATKEIQVWKFF